MAWSDPTANLTFATAEVATAAKLNLIRDNLLETAPAKITGGTATYIVGTAANTITERQVGSGSDNTDRTTTSTSYAALTGQVSVTVTTGTRALVLVSARLSNGTVNAITYLSFAVSGATTAAANENWTLWFTSPTAGASARLGIHHFSTLTAGSNTFALEARVTAGTGTIGRQRLDVLPF